MSAAHLDIVDLREWCAAMQGRNIALFEQLGEWITATPAGAAQRLFATACHRHAWHAELWGQRLPSIPGETLPTPVSLIADRTPTAYAEYIAAILADVRGIGERCDAELDPSTARVVALVAADLAELHRAAVELSA